MLCYIVKRRFACNNLDLLNNICTNQLKIKPIQLLSSQIEIIKDPIDFYLTLNESIATASKRIALSSLYLGTGSLERFLIHRLKRKVQTHPRIQVRLLFDYYRSQRRQPGGNSIEIIRNLQDTIKPENINNFRAGYLKSRKNTAFQILKGSLAEVLGVHHMKLYIFDRDVLITGANLSQSYFTHRQDRYLMIRGSQELSGHLYDLVETLIDGSIRMDEQGELTKDKHDNINNYVKMWRFSNRPGIDDKMPIKETSKPKTEQKSQNKQTEQSTSLIEKQKLIKQNLRQTLSKTFNEDKIALILSKLHKEQFNKSEITATGEKVYIFPVTQLNLVDDNSDRQVLTEVLTKNIESGNTINISSGYMNFPKFLIDILVKSLKPITVLTSAPEANSFFEGGMFKRYIPYFYRVYERNLLKRSQPLNTIKIKEYIRWGWTYHAKGIWITETNPTGAMLTIVGSSNFNMRSYERDTECQLYIYSDCSALNSRLQKEWNYLEKDCTKSEMTVQGIDEDKDMKLGWFVKLMARLFRRFM